MDPVGFTLLGTALQTVSTLVGLAKEVDKVELTNNLIGFQGQLMKIQAEMAEQQETILKLRAENQELKSAADLKSRRQFHGNVYWVKQEEDGDKLEGPFCAVCWDSDNKVIRLLQAFGNFGRSAEEYEYRFDCQVHKASLVIPERAMEPFLSRLIQPLHK